MINGRVSNNRQLYYKDYRLEKKKGNYQHYAQIGDELGGRGDGTFENGEYGRWEVIADKPQDDMGVLKIISIQ